MENLWQRKLLNYSQSGESVVNTTVLDDELRSEWNSYRGTVRRENIKIKKLYGPIRVGILWNRLTWKTGQYKYNGTKTNETVDTYKIGIEIWLVCVYSDETPGW